MALLKLENVTKHYTGAGTLNVLNGINLDLAAGGSLAVVGPSGCGKSTLLNLIGALDQPSSGRITLAGHDLRQMPEPALAELRNRRIGFVFQQHFLLPQCSVLENILVPTLAFNSTATARRQSLDRAEFLLQRMGLMERRDHRPGRLSGGESQRTAVARALINRPDLLLADEPTGSLDRQSAETLGGLLCDLNREEGITLVVVTHALELARRMHAVYRLADGKLAPADDSSWNSPAP
ncbi:MAG: ABC transporter ATP-binding protein [Kiritimatiellia bacterium]|nr:ABC transporter ATP-binding protein [Lentisphaerota bacterium]